ncbi:MAG: hypothetical protein ACLSF7_04825 [Acutalibacteraceae bacterium]
MLGLPFPAGGARPACAAIEAALVKPSMKGANCAFRNSKSVPKMLHAGECREDIARFCIESVLAAIDAMAEELLSAGWNVSVPFCGRRDVKPRDP